MVNINSKFIWESMSSLKITINRNTHAIKNILSYNIVVMINILITIIAPPFIVKKLQLSLKKAAWRYVMKLEPDKYQRWLLLGLF